jgi:CheY-like chemotaxis protein
MMVGFPADRSGRTERLRVAMVIIRFVIIARLLPPPSVMTLLAYRGKRNRSAHLAQSSSADYLPGLFHGVRVTTKDPATTHRVLVVDDNEGDLGLLAEAVRSEAPALEILAFTSGKAALEYLRAGNQVHLILSDLNMPTMNGTEFFSHLVDDARFKSVPMAMMSSSSQERLPGNISRALRVPYFCKGTTWEDFVRLARTVDGLLQSRIDAEERRKIGHSLADHMKTPLP